MLLALIFSYLVSLYICLISIFFSILFFFCLFFFVLLFYFIFFFFFFQAEDGIRDPLVTGVQTCALPIWLPPHPQPLSPEGRGGKALPPDPFPQGRLMSVPELCVIFNPTAGRRRATRPLDRLRRRWGARAEFRPTGHAGHAAQLAHPAARGGLRGGA